MTVAPTAFTIAPRLKIRTVRPDSSARRPTLGAMIDKSSAHASGDQWGTTPLVVVEPVLALVTVMDPAASPVPDTKV